MLSLNGALSDILGAGARLLECACGPCIGMGQSPQSQGVSLRTFNRNFEGRSGTADAKVYLVSPETAVAAALTGEIMANYFSDVKVVGNIGIPYTSVAADTTEDTVTVAEISSFQLETIHEFKPVVSAILNITPDHLNRRHTMECYIETKEKIASLKYIQDELKKDIK